MKTNYEIRVEPSNDSLRGQCFLSFRHRPKRREFPGLQRIEFYRRCVRIVHFRRDDSFPRDVFDSPAMNDPTRQAGSSPRFFQL